MKAHAFLYTVLVFALAALPLRSQFQRGMSAESAAELSEDVKARANSLPKDERLLFEEQKWVTDQLSRIRSQLRQQEGAESETAVIADSEERWNALLSRVRSTDCRNLDAANSAARATQAFLEPIEFAISPPSSFSRDLSLRIQRALTSDGLEPLGQSPVQLTADQCTSFQQSVINELSPAIAALFAAQRQEADKQAKEVVLARASLAELEKSLTAYRDALRSAQGKLSTKASLQTNLYLMILIIGLLSIAAIGLVRLFPEPVMVEWVVSGQVIQFVTIMILLSVIMALGLSGLLTENTLGTLLGGIAGYVLSQGVGRAVARVASRAAVPPGGRDA